VIEPVYRDELATIFRSDARRVLAGLPDRSLDALVTDPPAGIAFMGRDWDRDHGGRDRWIEHRAQDFEAVLRVLKPGAHGLVWAIPRTSHWTATALEDAGFEVRDVVHHLFAQGFPKSLDVSKAIDRAAGAVREVVERGPTVRRLRPGADQVKDGTWEKLEDRTHTRATTAPATDAARRWQGWGTALKPATEHWILVRKPLGAPSVAANVLEHDTGALNVDGCRIAGGAGGDRAGEASAGRRYMEEAGDFAALPGPRGGDARGRWPANLVLSHAEGCLPSGTRLVPTGTAVRRRGATGGRVYSEGRWAHQPGTPDLGYADSAGMETVEAWDCVDGCPVAALDRQSSVLVSGANPTRRGSDKFRHAYGDFAGDRECTPSRGADSGGASRFFYVAKASVADRDAGLVRSRNRHPTVKPVALMRYLVRLVTPPGGVVLDCFAGSGSTLVAAKLEGFRSIGIERDPESVATCVRRLAWAVYQPALVEVDAVT
jgi:DNA methylase